MLTRQISHTKPNHTEESPICPIIQSESTFPFYPSPMMTKWANQIIANERWDQTNHRISILLRDSLHMLSYQVAAFGIQYTTTEQLSAILYNFLHSPRAP